MRNSEKSQSSNNKNKKLQNEFSFPESLETEQKLKILTEIYNKSEETVMHFDNLRQRNLNLALIIFAGLFGLGIKVDIKEYQFILSIAITFLMIIFFIIDYKFHKRTHGFRGAANKLIKNMSEIENMTEVKFQNYDNNYANKAELNSLHSIIYYALILGGLLTLLVFIKI